MVNQNQISESQPPQQSQPTTSSPESLSTIESLTITKKTTFFSPDIKTVWAAFIISLFFGVPGLFFVLTTPNNDEAAWLTSGVLVLISYIAVPLAIIFGLMYIKMSKAVKTRLYMSIAVFALFLLTTMALLKVY